MKKLVLTQKLGIIDYLVAWRYQKKLLESLLYKQKNTNNKYVGYILFAEHIHVYTLGKGGNIDHIKLSSEELDYLGIYFYNSDRGGDITYHGFGQLIVYPILDLEYFFTDIHKYLRMLEEVVINLLEIYRLPGRRSIGETGVWLDVGRFYQRKICSLGVRASRWIMMHGLALNVNTDLRSFKNIIPCGILGKGVSSMQQELGYKISMNDIIKIFTFIFSDKFQVHVHSFT
ncbi:lipoate-protein ligase B [Candidatus Uzinura diaspidicola str. ASNER]|uniref:Octanoyltransferase n=1 Tax=Candidatus Uzinura diaspidicola str. ASNER TaxID=1133592 RepID=L7VN19_9FLAO|nr:lipoate-protein ligase B [Candidatus Uzinura diaspidicola str. ASNER]